MFCCHGYFIWVSIVNEEKKKIAVVAPIPAPASKYFSISAHKFVCLEFCFALFCSVRFGTILFCSCTCLPVVGDHLKSLKQNTTNCFNSQVYWFKKPSITFFVCVCSVSHWFYLGKISRIQCLSWLLIFFSVAFQFTSRQFSLVHICSHSNAMGNCP